MSVVCQVLLVGTYKECLAEGWTMIDKAAKDIKDNRESIYLKGLFKRQLSS